MKTIKTITNRLFCQIDFDVEVNTALSRGWTLIRRDIIKPSEKTDSDPVNSMLYAELEREELSPDVKKIFDYIEEAISRPHGDSFWIDEKGHRETVDVCDAVGWWCELMKPELLRVMPGIIARGEPET